jgi:transcription antitermination factor NusG
MASSIDGTEILAWILELENVISIDTRENKSFGWFAIYVQSKHEKVVASQLATKGFDTCLPLAKTIRKWSDRRKEIEEPIFKGYVFCQFNSELRTPILQTAGVIQILGAGKQVYPLEPTEITALKALERAKAPVEPWPFITKGQWVCIESGPLEGLTGVVVECKAGLRVVVSVALLQRSVAVEVNRTQVRPTTDPSHHTRGLYTLASNGA